MLDYIFLLWYHKFNLFFIRGVDMRYEYKDKEIFPTVEIYHDVIPYLGNITEKEFYLDSKPQEKFFLFINFSVAKDSSAVSEIQSKPKDIKRILHR